MIGHFQKYDQVWINSGNSAIDFDGISSSIFSITDETLCIQDSNDAVSGLTWLRPGSDKCF